MQSFQPSWLVFGVCWCKLSTHCWCQLLIQIADLNCWCQLIADEDDEGSVLCGEIRRQRYLDQLDRKDLRIFPDLESIQHMLISLAPSFFWFPAAICHLIILTIVPCFPSVVAFVDSHLQDFSWPFSGYLSVWLLQYLSRLWSAQDGLLPKYSQLWQCICTTSKFAFPPGSQGGLCCTLTQKKLKNEIHQPFEKLYKCQFACYLFLCWPQIWWVFVFCLSVFRRLYIF